MTSDERLREEHVTDERLREEHVTDERLREEHATDDSTPWALGLAVAAFVAAVIAAAVIVLSIGLARVHPLLAVGLNLVAVGGLAPTVWGWRKILVWRWFVLGGGLGVAGAWIALLALAATGAHA